MKIKEAILVKAFSSLYVIVLLSHTGLDRISCLLQKLW